MFNFFYNISLKPLLLCKCKSKLVWDPCRNTCRFPYKKCPVLMKSGMFRQILAKLPSVKFNENQLSGSWVTCRHGKANRQTCPTRLKSSHVCPCFMLVYLQIFLGERKVSWWPQWIFTTVKIWRHKPPPLPPTILSIACVPDSEAPIAQDSHSTYLPSCRSQNHDHIEGRKITTGLENM
jgi:hypothetical protein